MLETSQLAGLLETNFVVKPVGLLARWFARWFGCGCMPRLQDFKASRLQEFWIDCVRAKFGKHK